MDEKVTLFDKNVLSSIAEKLIDGESVFYFYTESS